MNIPIPEVTKCFCSIDNAIVSVIRYCNVVIEKAKKVYPSASVNDVPGYALEFCRKMLAQATTLVKVAREREDYNTVCSLVRIMADNVAVLKLIYGADDQEEKELRHLLYVMDGVATRYEYLKDKPKPYDGNISKEAYETLSTRVREIKDNAIGCINFCTDAIKARHNYYVKPQCYDILIRYRNWKFKLIDKPKPQDSYSWNDMYNLLNINNNGYIFSFFSQYVHGLSISNLDLNDGDDFEAPLVFAFSLLAIIYNFLRKEYEPYIDNYTLEDILKIMPDLLATNKNN